MSHRTRKTVRAAGGTAFAAALAALFLLAALAPLSGGGIVSAQDGAVPAPPGLGLVHGSLLQAVRARDLYAAARLKTGGADTGEKDGEGRDAWLFSAAEGMPHVMSLLAGKDFDINRRDAFGNTAVHLAARAGDVYTLRMLRQMGAEMNLPNDRFYSPLHEACEAGSAASVKALLLMGAPLEQSFHPDRTETAPMIAQARKYWNISRLFRAFGMPPSGFKGSREDPCPASRRSSCP